jgi:hypothetical protein
MNDWLDGLVRERVELFEFVLEMMTWIESPATAGRLRLIRRARKVATVTNHPKPFASFANWLIDQDQPYESETR